MRQFSSRGQSYDYNFIHLLRATHRYIIHPSWPRSSVRLSLLLVLFPKYISCLLWPTQYLAVCSNGSCFTLNPFLTNWRLNTSVQVNNMAALHHIHRNTHIYITSVLLFILFFTLLPPPFGRPAASDSSRLTQE
jgi:hypothetical protein